MNIVMVSFDVRMECNWVPGVKLINFRFLLSGHPMRIYIKGDFYSAVA